MTDMFCGGLAAIPDGYADPRLVSPINMRGWIYVASIYQIRGIANMKVAVATIRLESETNQLSHSIFFLVSQLLLLAF